MAETCGRRCPRCRRLADHFLDVVGEATTWIVLNCRHCHIGFVANPPDEGFLDRFYRSDDYYARYAGCELWSRWQARHHHARRLGILESLTEGRRLLDVGCADGSFVAAADLRAWQAEGVDINPASVAVGRSRGITARMGRVEEQSYSSPFHVLTLFHILEHQLDPGRFLRSVLGLLAPRGLLLVVVPVLEQRVVNLFTSLLPRPQAQFYLQIMGSIYPPNHLFFFSTRSLVSLLEGAGFSVKRVEYTTNVKPRFMGARQWRRSIWIGLLLWILRTGRHVEIYAKK